MNSRTYELLKLFLLHINTCVNCFKMNMLNCVRFLFNRDSVWDFIGIGVRSRVGQKREFANS